jgi:hypothetical protein
MTGVYGFSVQSREGVALEVLAAKCPNNRLGVTTVGTLRASGYDVEITRGYGFHATVVVPRDWSPEAARRLGGARHDNDQAGANHESHEPDE